MDLLNKADFTLWNACSSSLAANAIAATVLAMVSLSMSQSRRTLRSGTKIEAASSGTEMVGSIFSIDLGKDTCTFSLPFMHLDIISLVTEKINWWKWSFKEDPKAEMASMARGSKSQDPVSIKRINLGTI